MEITSINPWLIKAEGTYWGEYFFVEVTTDEGLLVGAKSPLRRKWPIGRLPG
jgi:hypothetical protein